MSADLLRRAAASMREKAEAATPGPWEYWKQHGRDIADEGWSQVGVANATPVWVALTYPTGFEHEQHEADATHIAAWDPTVALAVADWLDSHAEWVAEHEDCGLSCEVYDPETDPGVELAWRFLREES